jgi:hypothetical protein
MRHSLIIGKPHCMREVIQPPALEPVVLDASPIARQVVKAHEAVEVIDRNLRHGLRFGKPQVHRDAPLPFLVGLQRPPVDDAAARGAEVKPERLATHIGLRRPGDVTAFAFEVIDPQSAVATTRRAVASRGPPRATRRNAIELLRRDRILPACQSPFRSVAGCGQRVARANAPGLPRGRIGIVSATLTP